MRINLSDMLLSCMIINTSSAWVSEQLEVFDVVEEVKENFYNLLNISKDASSSEIKSAFRSLSLKLHPDKNLESDTSEQFRNIVSVYEILKSPTKRKYYDDVLNNGLPNWKSAMYYYRYVRKMSMWEACVILFIIITIGQHLTNWAVYFEKKFIIMENSKKKKLGRKGKTIEENIDIHFPKPSFFSTLPFQIPRLVWLIIMSVPSAAGFIQVAVSNKMEEVTKLPQPEPEIVKIKTIRKRNKFVPPEGPSFETTQSEANFAYVQSSPPPPLVGGLWTDDDLSELIRLVKKYPQGSLKRWENIAEALYKSIPEVTYMANKMKENAYKLPSEMEEEAPELKVKWKTRKEFELNDSITKWNQMQQKAFEEALANYPKRSADRWDKIADRVHGKTKEECMMRYKYLAGTLKKQREHTSTEFGDIRNNEKTEV